MRPWPSRRVGNGANFIRFSRAVHTRVRRREPLAGSYRVPGHRRDQGSHTSQGTRPTLLLLRVRTSGQQTLHRFREILLCFGVFLAAAGTGKAGVNVGDAAVLT